MFGELEKLVDTDGSPVAVKLSKLPPANIPKLGKKVKFCQMLASARRQRRAFYAEPEDHECSGGAFWLGLSEEQTLVDLAAHIAGEKTASGKPIYANIEAVWNMLNQAKQVRMGFKIVSCIPVAYFDEHQDFEPDVVVCTGIAGMALKIIRANQFTADALDTKVFTKGAACSMSVAAPFLEQVIGITLSEPASRRYTGLAPEHLLVTIPWKRVPTIIKNAKEAGF